MMSMQEKNLVYYHDGVVDVGIIVVSLFNNPLQEEAARFIADVMLQKKKSSYTSHNYYRGVSHSH
ncbi:MAG: hypothetical protein ACP5GI_06595 [Sulfolobales archaeon]